MHKRNRLLFVDDEESIRFTFSRILQERGFDVTVAASVPEALQEIQDHNFDALISDLNIGQEDDGFTVIRAMRQVNPDCVTIILTGYPAFETAVRGIQYQIDDYVVKPADIDSLVARLKEKLGARPNERGNAISGSGF